MIAMGKAIDRLFGHSENPVLHIGSGDSPQDVLSKLGGGWATMLAAHPQSRRKIEEWQGDCAAEMLQAVRAGNENLAAEWEQIAELFAEILGISHAAYEERKRAAREAA